MRDLLTGMSKSGYDPLEESALGYATGDAVGV